MNENAHAYSNKRKVQLKWKYVEKARKARTTLA
jgi:hypothetical protein